MIHTKIHHISPDCPGPRITMHNRVLKHYSFFSFFPPNYYSLFPSLYLLKSVFVAASKEHYVFIMVGNVICYLIFYCFSRHIYSFSLVGGNSHETNLFGEYVTTKESNFITVIYLSINLSICPSSSPVYLFIAGGL